MKRLMKYDTTIAVTALLIWVALVVAEVKFKELWFFKYLFWGSLVALFVAFPVASLLALRAQPIWSRTAAAGASLLLTPIFIVVGVMLVWWFKMTIGGHPS